MRVVLATALLAACTPRPVPDPCSTPLPLQWPLAGADGRDWVINHYVDLNPADPGIRDYTGGERTYEDHAGVDIDIAGFRAMDAGVPVLAAGPGLVTEVIHDRDDRRVTCADYDWNVVRVRHDDGTTGVYGHLREGSVGVAVGDRVQTGAILGQVGSSGCSDGPHLHFEVRDCDGTVLDPFATGRWAAPPPYDGPADAMDIIVVPDRLSAPPDDIRDLKRARPNPDAVGRGAWVTLAVAVAAAPVGTFVGLRLRDPGGEVRWRQRRQITERFALGYWYWTYWVAGPPGSWTLEAIVDGRVRRRTALVVRE